MKCLNEYLDQYVNKMLVNEAFEGDDVLDDDDALIKFYYDDIHKFFNGQKSKYKYPDLPNEVNLDFVRKYSDTYTGTFEKGYPSTLEEPGEPDSYDLPYDGYEMKEVYYDAFLEGFSELNNIPLNQVENNLYLKDAIGWMIDEDEIVIPYDGSIWDEQAYEDRMGPEY